jgi:hypothetical protein
MTTTVIEARHIEPTTSERSWFSKKDVRQRFAEDMKKLSSAAAKLRIHRRKVKEGKQKQLQQNCSVEQSNKRSTHVLTFSTARIPERRWTLTDLLHNLGVFVLKHCTHLSTIPSATDVAMWVRCADRALQLNGWTVNSFLLESHVVFTYMLLHRAFQQFQVRSLIDVKELVLMCLYISYTYNANEISYPLRPFLVKHDRMAFWDKCTPFSLSASSRMLRLNQDPAYYAEQLVSLKSVTAE